MSLQHLSQLLKEFIDRQVPNVEPKNLYEPMRYILDLGGKRLRPLLTLMMAQGYGAKPEDALSAALAVEVFHNFTLLHDDIMDHADIRRGQPTVHKRWDENIAILSGDMMLVKAYQYLEPYEPKVFKALAKTLSQTAVEVCEGQQYDMDFETLPTVSIEDYMEMIRLKTAVLLGCALQMGAIIAGVSDSEQRNTYDFGVELGLAFQLQDDYLDSFGDEVTFGKQIGGDILEDKKTWLYLMTKNLCSDEDLKALENLQNFDGQSQDKISKVKLLYTKYGVDQLIRQEINQYSQKATELLKALNLSEDIIIALNSLIVKLNERNH